MELSSDGDRVFLLDQRELPTREVYLGMNAAAEVASAIRSMVVRGAPAIGITAAYGMALASHAAQEEAAEGYLAAMRRAAAWLSAARPTAVNLDWAVKLALK